MLRYYLLHLTDNHICAVKVNKNVLERPLVSHLWFLKRYFFIYDILVYQCLFIMPFPEVWFYKVPLFSLAFPKYVFCFVNIVALHPYKQL